MNTKVIEIKSDFKKILGLIGQSILLVLIIVFGIISIFNKDFKTYLYLILSLNMLMLVVNNYLIIKRKNMNIIYLIVAVYTFILFIKGLNG